ncbi:MAG: UDP-N-acetyl-D-glucosamine 2-epimerase, UDP-hydrolysing [Elusimicrobia bacterium RIFOXYA12_FULL_51_18]|nr:MAG: UDP-N-acetyl-D-glucosamine 2-epimerase, UDP-hydrolysing [Elusimicrobia bacterium RIFOXYA12_FULL_51_18]OGS32866.1 MAG: UDP-N-acetyl-D-glucosamine 2-epimerase, UDP-hydrolysing [Elusimicrobia bacterium RIFOXYA2_FULL_53_38]
MRRFKICVFTGTRAEYGLLRPLMRLIRADKDSLLQVIASGTHLSPKFGLTYREILKDGFKIDMKARMRVGNDSPAGLCAAMSDGLVSIARAYDRLGPDAVVILGDRFEALSAAIASVLMRIPIIHLHGGESTFGVIDESIRHSITKMSWLHFTSTEKYRKRVIQLGEEPSRVFKVGAVGLDSVRTLKLLEKPDLERRLGIVFDGPVAAVTFHPATLESGSAGEQFLALLNALDLFPDLKLVFTMPNADTGRGEIVKLVKRYVRANSKRARAFISLGQLGYLSLLKHAAIVIGNSSSGIIEAPSFRIPTVNIGDRQRGRVQGPTVIDCAPRSADIAAAIKRGLTIGFLKKCGVSKNPYGDGKASPRIFAVLKARIRKGADLKKVFYDLRP